MNTEITPDEILDIIQENGTAFIPTGKCEKCDYQSGFFIHSITKPEPIEDVEQPRVADIWYDGGCDCKSAPRSHRKTGIGELVALYNDQPDDAGREAVLASFKGPQ